MGAAIWEIDVHITEGYLQTLGDVVVYFRLHLMRDIPFLKAKSKVTALFRIQAWDSEWESKEFVLSTEDISLLFSQVQKMGFDTKELDIYPVNDTSDAWTKIEVYVKNLITGTRKSHEVSMQSSGVTGRDAQYLLNFIRTLATLLGMHEHTTLKHLLR